MAERIVDRLELIQIEKADSHPLRTGSRLFENLFKLSFQKGPVRQSRQRIVLSQITDALVGDAPVNGDARHSGGSGQNSRRPRSSEASSSTTKPRTPCPSPLADGISMANIA